jgi:CheY-like chemotaxis protein
MALGAATFQTPKTHMHQTKLRILFVDDHEDMHTVLAAILGRSGHHVVSVNNPLSALVLARNQGFDLFILDGLFTDGTGIELCKRIREFDSSTPIVFFSGDSKESTRHESMNAGAQAYIAKPDISGLQSMVNAFTECQVKSYGFVPSRNSVK